MHTRNSDLRIKAERIIRADRILNGLDASHLDFERQYIEAMKLVLEGLTRINRALDHLFS